MKFGAAAWNASARVIQPLPSSVSGSRGARRSLMEALPSPPLYGWTRPGRVDSVAPFTTHHRGGDPFFSRTCRGHVDRRLVSAAANVGASYETFTDLSASWYVCTAAAWQSQAQDDGHRSPRRIIAFYMMSSSPHAPRLVCRELPVGNPGASGPSHTP